MTDAPKKLWALCLGGCGVVDQATLIACDFDPLGLCPKCEEQACDCSACLTEAVSSLPGSYDALQSAITSLKAPTAHE